MGLYETNKQEINLSILVKDAMASFQERFPLRLCNIIVEDEIIIQGETLLLQILVNNLLDNAHKYSPVNMPITIHLHNRNHKIILAVEDKGKGVPMNERDKIFEKFYRVGDESTRSAKGTGLGLYLCKKITTFHNAIIQIQSNQTEGSIFTVTFNNS